MAQTKYNQIGAKTKQVTAEAVYQLTNETLQEIFRLDLAAGRYEAQDIWDVLIAAAVERGTGLGLKPRRFGIETSYRLMNTMRARTSSTSVTLRLFYIALALLLLNLWSYIKWHFLFVPNRGPGQVLHHLLPLARWRLWLWEMVKQRLGFSLSITVPLST